MKLLLTILSTIFLVTACVLGAIVYHQYKWAHPKYVLHSGIENADDVLLARKACNTTTIWNTELHKGFPEKLVLLTCPKIVKFKIDEKDREMNEAWPADRQVLLLERQTGGQVDILTARIPDSNVQRVAPGKSESGEQAVLWSFMDRCGSCHSGPEGILLWNPSHNAYEWNDDLSASIRETISSRLPADYYLDEAQKLSWEEYGTYSVIQLQADVHTASDAHCCPSGGKLSAIIHFKEGVLSVSQLEYHPPDKPGRP